MKYTKNILIGTIGVDVSIMYSLSLGTGGNPLNIIHDIYKLNQYTKTESNETICKQVTKIKDHLDIFACQFNENNANEFKQFLIENQSGVLSKLADHSINSGLSEQETQEFNALLDRIRANYTSTQNALEFCVVIENFIGIIGAEESGFQGDFSW